MKHFYLNITLLLLSLTAFSQAPNGYYNSATGTGYTLKTQLKDIIDNNSDGLSPEYQATDPGYGGLYVTYQTSDVDNYYENNGSLLDMYTENPSGTDVKEYDHITDQDPGSGGTAEGQFFNREHLIPQSVFNQATPQRNDAHFVIPADKYINGERASFPFGVVDTPASNTYTNGSKKGNNLDSGYSAGYSGTVFEPIDEFKGDIARMHFYFVTRYEDNVAGYSYEMFNNTSTQVFTDTFLSILLQWHAQDPVSTREQDRNNAIFARQNNRNPFIDNPNYVNMIWGGGSADTQAPTTPTNLVASNPTSNTVDLTWTASTDDTAVTGYDVYVDGGFYVSTNSAATSYTVTALAPSTTHAFTVLAVDAANNMSGLSTSVNETTLAGSGGDGNCANEDFEDIPADSSGYSNRTWTGTNGIWNATEARTDQTLNTRAIAIDFRGNTNGTLTSPAVIGGIGDFTITTQQIFTGTAGNLSLYVNGVFKGDIPYGTVAQTTTISGINVEGTTTILIQDDNTSGGSARVILDDLSWTCYSVPTDIKVSAKAYLQGPALNRSTVSGEEDWMRDDLRTDNLIPNTSPYDATTCNSSVFNTTGSDAIVDWILVQLRDANDNTSILESQSALIQRDGDIVSIDGTSALSFSLASGNYHIALKHHNHLGVMTLNAITLSTVVTTVDFTDANAPITFGTEAQTTSGMPSSILAMWGGDANNDGRLNYSGALSDVPPIRSQVFNDPNNTVFGGPPVATYPSIGYNSTDIDMDGVSVYSGAASDVLYIRNNIFNNPSNSVFGGPPTSTYVFTQQLPEGAN